MERIAVTNAQYHRRESVEVNPVPPSISDEELELNICKALSLTGHEVKPDDLQACHRLKKKESVIVKFKCKKLKRRVLVNRKNLRNKSEDLHQLKFSGKLFISESMCHENRQLAYKCRQLKNAGKIHSTKFWNNVVNVKLSERSKPVKIFHIIDIEKLFGINNFDDFISKTCVFISFYVMFSILSFLPTLVISYKPFFLLSDCANLIPSRYTLVFF